MKSRKHAASTSGNGKSEFTEEIFTAICERMADGEGLRKICSDRDMPSRSTFLRWVENDTGRQTKYQKAREALMDWYSEEILAIAWDDSKDTIKRQDKPDLCNHEWIGRSRLKVDTLKFLMAKLYPKRYGDKLPETEGAKDAEAARLQVSWEAPKRIERIILEGVLPETHLRDRIAELEKQLAGSRGETPPGPPKLLTYDPGPLPKHLDPDVLVRLVDTFKRSLPQDDQRSPETVLDEATSVIEQALRAHYGTSQAA